MENQQVWVRDSHEGYILGKIYELLGDEAEVIPLDSRYPKRTCGFDDIFPAGEYMKDVDDNCEMMFLNEATLLYNIRTRYNLDKIYSYVANILIAVNPYVEIKDLYCSKTIKSYQGKSLGVMPPHVFAIADKSFRDMKTLKQSQSIIVSGESGAGKTESTKYILKYLCELFGSAAGPIEQKILDANPILEAFGNAKTTRNNNSSRFGKFIEVHFNSKYQVVGGHISHYLLEKSRICIQGSGERNYHVFYLLCAGAPKTLRDKLHITKPDDYHYLRNGCTQYFTTRTSDKKLSSDQKSKEYISNGSLNDPLLDDIEDFNQLDKALDRTGLGENERFQIYSLVASVLHLGNITFEENPEDAKGGSRVAVGSEKSLIIASKLLGVDSMELRQALVSRVMQSSRGGMKGTVIMVPLKVYEANNARDALSKSLYSKLFDYVVNRINKSIPFQASSYYIGVLDIAGFEFFTVNSFEQFCINYCNEKLQQFFNERILKEEQDLYKKEGLNVPEIKYADNQDCIDLIESKGTGIFSILDEESKLPKPNYMHFTSEVHSRWLNHFRLTFPRSSRLKSHRTIRDDEGFLVRHFAGAVCYETNQFIEKNNDALHASLACLVQESSNPFLNVLFTNSENATQKGKLTFISVGSKFKTQLTELMDKLKSNGTNFVRCIKPNTKMVSHQFEGALCLTQLKCSGMTTVLELMEHGYPSRAPFNELYNMYESYLPKELKKLNPKIFCEAMLHSLNLYEKDYKFGITRVFFRPGKFAEFDRIMKSDSENLKSVVANVKKWLVKSRWLKSQFAALAVIKIKNRMKYREKALIIVQKTVRGYLVKKKYMPRYKGIKKIKELNLKVKDLQNIAAQIKKDRTASEADIKNITKDIEIAISKIKSSDNINELEIEKIHKQLVDHTNKQMETLQKKMLEQKNAEEQERLRKIQEQMELERKRKEEEERKKREEEEMRKKKAEIEARRKIEEELRRKQEEEDKKMAAALKEQLEREALENRKMKEQLEQERQDHELALRLAEESNGQLEDSPPSVRSGSSDVCSFPNHRLIRSEAVRNQQAAQNNKKFDLSKWKYSELRDTINTSCDIELLEACRHEFHRRLKVYHAWKAKNRRRTTMDENERAPRSVMDAAARAPRLQQKIPITQNSHRYFRIPFVRPSTTGITNGNADSGTNKRGWWYAHFDGQYVARQMELHPDKVAILLEAGVDDMQMCELSLDETGLTRKRGAEILENEFNREWEKNGGKPYINAGDRKK